MFYENKILILPLILNVTHFYDAKVCNYSNIIYKFIVKLN